MNDFYFVYFALLLCTNLRTGEWRHKYIKYLAKVALPYNKDAGTMERW